MYMKYQRIYKAQEYMLPITFFFSSKHLTANAAHSNSY